MAINKGWDGEVKIGASAIAHMNNWEIAFSGDALENTAFGDTVYDRSYQPGLRSHSITISGYTEDTGTAVSALLNAQRASTAPAAVTVVCLYDNDTEKGWTGSAVITGLTVGAPVDGLSPFSGTFQVSGGLSTV